LLPLWDYQGSNVSWVVTTNIFSRGLLRQGFVELSEDMDARMLNGANIAQQYLEYFFVDNEGHVQYHHIDEPSQESHHLTVIGTNRPETTQAWTVSALLAATLRRTADEKTFLTIEPSYWQKKIEVEVLQSTPKTVALGTEEEILNTYPSPAQYYVDRHLGQQREIEVLKNYGVL
jgi:hypothetical protein